VGGYCLRFKIYKIKPFFLRGYNGYNKKKWRAFVMIAMNFNNQQTEEKEVTI